jgi:hypothetical protein
MVQLLPAIQPSCKMALRAKNVLDRKARGA